MSDPAGDCISFTIPAARTGSSALTVVVTPVPGSVRVGGGHDDKGGGTLPSVRAGYAKNGSCQVVVTTATATDIQHTLAELISIISPVGDGDIIVQGWGRYSNIESYDALVDVSIGGDAVQTADISWKGTYVAPAA